MCCRAGPKLLGAKSGCKAYASRSDSGSQGPQCPRQDAHDLSFCKLTLQDEGFNMAAAVGAMLSRCLFPVPAQPPPRAWEGQL